MPLICKVSDLLMFYRFYIKRNNNFYWREVTKIFKLSSYFTAPMLLYAKKLFETFHKSNKYLMISNKILILAVKGKTITLKDNVK